MKVMVPFCDVGADLFIPSFTFQFPKTETRATFVSCFQVEFTEKTTIEEIIGLVLREVTKICPSGDLAIFERKVSTIGVDKFTLTGKIYHYEAGLGASAK